MLQRVDWKKSQYQTPSLPAIPERVMGKAAFSCLTHRDQAEWTFLFEEIASIPSPYANNQDFDFDTIAPDRWRKVVVPGSLILQGFDIENNTEYYYRRKISIPDSFAQKRVFLRFEGVYSNARVWVNNQFLKTHIGGFTAWDCEITPFAHEKEIMLVVGVTDVEGERKGIKEKKSATPRGPATMRIAISVEFFEILRCLRSQILILPAPILIRK